MGDSGEKSEEASPEKLRKAQEEGQVPKSQDFVGAMGFASGFLALAALFTYIATEIKDFTLQCFDAAARNPGLPVIGEILSRTVPLIIRVAAPVGAVVFVFGIFTNVIQTGFFLAFKVLTPKFDKINPVNGLKGMFKVKKFIDLLKNIIKMGIAAWLAWDIMSAALHDMVLTVSLPIITAVDYAGGVLWEYMIKTVVLFVIIGGADFLYSRHTFAKEMMMSKYDVKQEYKQSEGDPHMKGQRKQLAQELLFGGGGHRNVKNADAVVVNPVNIAVAIKYDKDRSKAPTVVAKGMRVHAEKIKELAKQYGIPILRNVPLAQALNKLEIDEEIPEELYEAVAEVLAFVYKIREEQENRQKKQREEGEQERSARADVGGPRGAGQNPASRENLLKRKR